jgi:hypothetical protein
LVTNLFSSEYVFVFWSVFYWIFGKQKFCSFPRGLEVVKEMKLQRWGSSHCHTRQCWAILVIKTQLRNMWVINHPIIIDMNWRLEDDIASCIMSVINPVIFFCTQKHSQISRSRSQRPLVRIPMEAWMSVCVSPMCACSGLATGWFPVQGVLPTV